MPMFDETGSSNIFKPLTTAYHNDKQEEHKMEWLQWIAFTMIAMMPLIILGLTWLEIERKRPLR